jgi:glutamyl-tRNA synthetase/glutamyl-Q tRNA(Asp) synthetase
MRTRFAPSPTGELHLGHVAHATWLWETAKRHNAEVIVRMEDHDRLRCTADYEQSILADLDWLGFEPTADSLSSLASSPSALRQSDHPERYERAFAALCQVTEVYGCTCTRSMLQESPLAGERHYPGSCRGQPIERDGRHVVRATLATDEVRFVDERVGEVVQHPARDLGDVAVRDANGQWTYQFCVVVDDMHDKIDLIVRGEDLLASTGRQWLLAKLLGRATPPVTLHHPLLYDRAGRKLSKRDRSETVQALRGSGLQPADVIALAMAGHRG